MICTTDAEGVIDAQRKSQQLTDELMPYWRQYRDLFIARWCARFIGGMNAVSLRQAGGVYFVPESYRESCEREIRNLIGNAVPKNFSWEDLMMFVPNGEQIIEVSPVYKSRRQHMPVGVILLLSNDEIVRLSLF
jgi:hypothetical protein